MQTSFPELKKKHDEARTSRRTLEKEFAGIDAKIQQATRAGDLDQVNKLRARRDDLPTLYAAASHAETEARRAWHQAELKAASEVAKRAEDALNQHRAERDRQQREHEELMAELARKDLELVQAKATADSTAGVWSNEYHTGEQGFQKALAAI